MTEPLAVPIHEAHRLIGCGRSTLYSLIKSGEIPVLKIGRRSVVPVAGLRAFVINNTKEAA